VRTRVVAAIGVMVLLAVRAPVALGAPGDELGADTRVSSMGANGDTVYAAESPAVVYNPDLGEYLVVWSADDNAGALVDNEFEIYAQRVDGPTGGLVGPRARVSDMGPDGSNLYAAFDPAVAYNPAQGEYVITWRGDDNTAPLVDDEVEIYAQRLGAGSGAEIGVNDQRISDMGPDGSNLYSALRPAVAYNPAQGEYLIAGTGTTTPHPSSRPSSRSSGSVSTPARVFPASTPAARTRRRPGPRSRLAARSAVTPVPSPRPPGRCRAAPCPRPPP